jgi:ABC-type transport system involved in multi-copper enzyme maturation permease subunit
MSLFLQIAPTWVSTWLTPIWLLGVGALVGLVVLLIVWGLISVVSWNAGKLVPSVVWEGPLLPIFIVTLLLAGFGIVGTLAVRNPGSLIASLQRLPSTGTRVYTFNIEPAKADESRDISEIKPQKIDIRLQRDEVAQLQFDADVNVTVSANEELFTETVPRFNVSGGDPLTWNKSQKGDDPFTGNVVDALYVWNTDVEPTTLRIAVTTAPAYGEVIAIPVTAALVVLIFALYFLQRILMPKIAAVSLATAKSEMAQPLFLICMVIGFFLLTAFVVLPYNTFGEDIKMLKDTGLTLIMVLAIITCLWAASNSISEEIEGRTALTVLSKPIGRRQFILGKFSGITWVAAVMFLLLGLWFLITIAYKPLYDARETANTDPDWRTCFEEMAQTAPGLVLGFFETVVLASISVAISTRLPMLANFIICVSIYALGHLTPMLVKSSVGNFEGVVFVARLLATVLPVLEHFDIKPAISGGIEVPLAYLGTALLYCILYSTVAMLLALTLFEDRDLA